MLVYHIINNRNFVLTDTNLKHFTGAFILQSITDTIIVDNN